MRTIPQTERRRKHEWTMLAAFVCLALTLAAAVLDRRNAILDRIEAPQSQLAHPADPPAPAAMVQDMMEHD